MKNDGVRSHNALACILKSSERVFSFYIPGVFLAYICLFITTEILARLLFNYSFVGVVDLVEQTVVMVTYLSIAGVQSERGHITMDLLPNKLKTRRAGPILDCFFLGVGIITMLVVLIAVTFYWIHTIHGGDQLPTLVWPKWPFTIAMPLGILFMLLRLVMQFTESCLLVISEKPFEEVINGCR